MAHESNFISKGYARGTIDAERGTDDKKDFTFQFRIESAKDFPANNISNNNHGAHIDNMTIVTAFFDLGSFRKGTSLTVTTQTYINWVKTFKYMNNSLVVYTDSVIFSDIFRELRRGMEQRTKIVFMNRTQLWAFQIHNAIKTIYSQEGYPKHFPNTVLPVYSCTQHSKYEVVADAVRKQYFKSKFYAWLDIGYFRDIVQSNKYFTLRPLDDFDRNRLAVNLVYPSLSLNVSYKSIVYNNQVWVGGGMFIGTADVLLALEKEYKRAVMFLLDKRLISTDQQVILSMYSVQGRKDLNTTLQLQVYSRRQNETNLKNGNPWFYLGYKCLNFAST
ncbi:uncharacterized protein LOC132555447 [Ylistrum balloti]|uniref:uncharacterized protein LOC132555447 n=1 Tax=Ylistrum balloti TaxID=509963 RepID=UPI002905E709|nr:uncharacterized protein LOC132555447 [Ylistrum balloti]